MTYQQTVDWLFVQLPMYQQQGASAYKPDLSNTLKLAKHLGHPENSFKSIHVAGTNGKGSTSHMLASVLQQAGFKTGLYTSPHLKDFRERIKINGRPIAKEFVVDFVAQNKTFFESHNLSFFEMSVGLAFYYFSQEQVDFAIIEVGLGGRLDSTNIITPLVSVITNIGLDHTQFLGITLAAIAGEKAGIIKAGVPVVIGEYVAETKSVFMDKAHQRNAPIYFASEANTVDYALDLKGNYQQHNKKTVLETLRVLRQEGFPIPESAVREGLLNVIKNTGLMGRWQQLCDAPKIIADTAHNKAGLGIVMAQVAENVFERLHMVIGVVNDKDLDEILPLFPKNALYYFCTPNIPRGLNAETLAQKAKNFGLIGGTFDSVSSAYNAAINSSTADDFIYVGGSTFVVAEIL